MIAVPDAASVAMAWALEPVLGRRVGVSTGTNVWGALTLAGQMHERGEAGSIVTLLCDGGERYAQRYFDDAWLAEQGLNIAPYTPTITRWLGGPRP
jgi:cysteine synthase A